MAFTADNVEQVIRQVGEPIARALGVDILEVQCTGRPANLLVRLTLDKKGGVGIGDCEQFHQSLRRTWEVLHPEHSAYRFEISSPGLDRPLRDQSDFQRVVGERLRITLKNSTKAQSIVIGELMTVTEMGIHLKDDQSKNPQEIILAWADISKARLEVTF